MLLKSPCTAGHQNDTWIDHSIITVMIRALNTYYDTLKYGSNPDAWKGSNSLQYCRCDLRLVASDWTKKPIAVGSG